MTLLVIVGLLVIALCSISFVVFISTKRKKYISIDGTSFKTDKELKVYEELIAKLKPLFEDTPSINRSTPILGLDLEFIKSLKEGGFKDVKTLVKNKEKFNLLNEILNQ